MTRWPDESSQPPPPQFKAGDWAVHVIGRSRFPVRILEDEGPVGWRGVRHYRYLKHGPDAPAYETGGPEAELEPARPDEVPAGG